MSSTELKDKLAKAISTVFTAAPVAVACAVLVLVLSALMLGLFSRKDHFKPSGKHCYIGGGSEGLGLALACQLADRGAHVSIVSRSEVKLKKALAELETHRQTPAQKFAYYPCDLTSPDDASTTLHAACAPFGEAPDFIFACAGGSVPGFFVDTDVKQHWKCMEWNFMSALCTVHEGIKRMKDEGKQGKVVFTGSVLSMMAFAGFSTYSPSKYAIRGLVDSLRNELILYGITVHLALPASILSPSFIDYEQKIKPELTKKIEGPDEPLTPHEVAARMLKGLERNDYYITVEPIGTMLRNSRGIVPRNNVVMDTLWGIAGTIGFPIWRMFEADALVRKEGVALRAAGKLPKLR
ncbi:hypothetical protein RQP46_002773 [Phenoliferia psychrophenolica]